MINRLLSAPTKRPGRLVRAVFIAAYVFPPGFVMDAKQFVGSGDPNFSIDYENGINVMANTRTVFFNDIASDAEAQPWVDALQPAYYLGDGPVISSDAWRTGVPVTVVLAEKDQAIPAERAKMVWQGFEVVWVDAGHSPFVSRPEMIGEIIAGAVS